MRRLDERDLRRILLGSAAMAMFAAANPVKTMAQEAEDEAVEEVEQIVVTGSRIRRDAFSSTTPLQVLEADQGRKLGVTNITELLQRSTVSTGQQIDNTINTNAGNSNATEAPPTGGIGSSNIDLRGLGPERTLVLVNGRRLGSGGVRGAPAQPDINLLPLGMVEGVDILTGGLSTIYGADAVAGVANVRLRSDFEGIEIYGSGQLPEAGGGEVYQTSLIAGVGSERGNITVGFEYRKQERVATGNRDFSNCLRLIEESEDRKERFDPCRSGFFDNVLVIGNDFLPGFEPGAEFPNPGDSLSVSDSIFFYYTPGQTDIGIPDFSTGFNLPQPTDPQVANFPNPLDSRAILRFPFNDDFNDQDERRAADLVRPEERFSLVANGHLDLDWGNNERFFFEAYFFDRKNTVIGAKEQIFADFPGLIPQEDENGNLVVDENGAPVLFDNPLNPFPISVAPIVTLDDLPQNFEAELQQFRGVLGMEGDIGAGWFKEKNWHYNGFFSFDRATGFQAQTILFEPNLQIALETLRLDVDGNPICGLPNNSNANGFLTPQDCVVVNLMAPSIFNDGEGRFASDAERDFLLGNRTNRTITQQFNAGFYIDGNLFDIPWGETAATAFGAEWRRDTINSQNDIVGARGLNAAENPVQEGETAGSRWIYDIYGEVTLPIVTDAFWAERFQIDGAVRFTEEENFGTEVTYRIGALYRPVSYVTFSGAFNTSFRAPNLREQFLADQGGGIGGGADPCLAQSIAALDPTSPQTQLLVNNCTLSGADVSVLGTQGVTTIPIRVGGADDLVAETADTITASAQFSQPWFSGFDFDVALTYFDIEIKDTVNELDPEVIISRCFNDAPNLESPFCQRLTRPNTGNPASNIINFVDASFVNVGLEETRGLDLTTRFSAPLGDIGGNPLDLVWTTGTTYVLSKKRQVFSDTPIIDNAGRIGNPEWRVNSTLSLNWGRFQFLWQARYIGETEFAEDRLDPQRNVRVNPQFNTTTPTRIDQRAERRLYNEVSFTGDFDRFVLTFGVENLTDQDPPLIDASAGPNRNNAVSSAGFDFLGRTFFMSGTVRF